MTLGFFVKLNFYILTGFRFYIEPVGSFASTPEEFDQSLLAITLALFLILVVQKGISAIVTYDFKKIVDPQIEAKNVYWFQALMFTGFIAIGGVNFAFDIYQKGGANTNFKILNPILAWGLVFGFSSVMSYFVNQLEGTKYQLKSFILAICEIILSSLSLLSTGFVLNTLSIALARFVRIKDNFNIGLKRISIVVIGTFILSFSILWSAFFLRELYLGKQVITVSEAFHNTLSSRNYIYRFFGRWVGLEGVFSAISYKGDRVLIFQEINNEDKAQGKTSVYDREVAVSIYKSGVNITQGFKFITLPGIVGWLLVSANWLYLVLGLLAALLTCHVLELLCFTLNRNIYFSSIIGQVMAYRLCNFGYVPKDSYKLVLGIIFTAIFLFAIDKVVKLNQRIKLF